MIKNVLVVCIGNICRSPMAEGLMRRAMPELNILSAGLGALIGRPAEPNSVEVMDRVGVNIRSHRAQQLNDALVSKADLILVMDLEQRLEIQRRHPSATGKIFRLADAEKIDIPDPYKQSHEAFEHAFELIERGTATWATRIRALA